MSQTNLLLCLGTPVFRDPGLARLAQQLGAEGAWPLALADNPAAALAGVGGSFAVGWRSPGGRTVLAVDRFAAETLCWRIVDGELKVAARADQLADARTPIDPQAVFDYLYHHAIPSPRTIFQGIHRLPPAHMLVFENGRATVSPYWIPRFDERDDVPFDELKAEFRRLVQAGVARQLDGSVPACFLSGGTDSSTVAGMIGLAAGQPAHTYAIGFEAQGYDEMAYARIAAKAYGTRHHEYYVTPDDLVAGIPSVAASFDQPFGNSSVLPAYYCALRAREDGVSRLLAGDGGDELFGGNSRYAKQRVFAWYGLVPAPLRRGLLEPVLAQKAVAGLPLFSKAASYVEQAREPVPERLEMYNLLMRLGLAEVLTPGFRGQVDPLAPRRQQREVFDLCPSGSELNRTLAFEWRYTLAESDLPKVRSATALAQVAVGFPLLDTELLEFSLKLPTDHKLKGLKLRWFFKEALRGFLPDEIITKTKHGFGLPFGVWALKHEGLRRLASDSLASLAGRGIVQPAFIDTLLTRHLAAHPGYYGEMVWILMMLEQWLRAHAPDHRVAG